MTIIEQKRFWRRPETSISPCLLVAGLLVNYVAEKHSFIPLGVHPPGNTWGGLPDLFVPVAAFYLTLAGLILFVFALRARQAFGKLSEGLMISLLTSVPLTILYATFFFGMQWIASGTDRLGECPGLDAAATASHEIAQSLAVPGHTDVGCSVQRYGMFLASYNEISIYGAVDPDAQEHVLKNLSDYHKAADTHPIRVVFYEKENWGPLLVDKDGKGWGGKRGPENIIRVVTIR